MRFGAPFQSGFLSKATGSLCAPTRPGWAVSGEGRQAGTAEGPGVASQIDLETEPSLLQE